MPIESKHVAPGVLYSRTTGSPKFSEMAESREHGMQLLSAAGDREWVLIMDVADAKLPRPDMNVDTLRGFNRQNVDMNMVGYIVLGANPGVKLLMGAYRALFKVDILFETKFDEAVEKACAMLETKKQSSN